MNTFNMPQLLETDEAARRIVRAVRRGRKVYNFPWRLSVMTKLSRWLPDRVMIWVLGDYNADAAAHAAPPKL